MAAEAATVPEVVVPPWVPAHLRDFYAVHAGDIEAALAASPPLTDEQLSRLQVLLNP